MPRSARAARSCAAVIMQKTSRIVFFTAKITDSGWRTIFQALAPAMCIADASPAVFDGRRALVLRNPGRSAFGDRSRRGPLDEPGWPVTHSVGIASSRFDGESLVGKFLGVGRAIVNLRPGGLANVLARDVVDVHHGVLIARAVAH